MAGYVTAELAFVCDYLRTQESSSFCDFLNDLLRFHIFLLFLLKQTFAFSDMRKKEYCTLSVSNYD